MMDLQIDQFVSQQREAMEMDSGRDRERRRDRDRRHDRRERDRDDRRRHRERREHRDKDRDRRSRESEHSRSRERRSNSKEIYDDSLQYNEEDTYSSYSGDYYDRDDQTSYGDVDDRYRDEYRHDDYRNRQNSRDSKAADKWITDSVTNTVILKGLTADIDEKDIRAQLMMSSTPVKEVRLVRDKVTGASRGFAFVEFQSVGDAQQWMDQNQGRLYLLNQYHINMYYSTPKRELTQSNRNNSNDSTTSTSNVNPLMGVVGDWICSKCGVHNFKRREQCFKCNISRDASDRSKESEGYEHVGHNPCNTLVLRGLDALTSEETMSSALARISLLSLKNIKVIRDETTGVSKGYAFLELNSIADSTTILDTINKLQGTFEVDGKAVLVSYAKNTFSTVMATLNSQYYTGADYTQYQQTGYYGEDGQYYDASQYYGQYDYSQYYNQDGTPVTSAAAETTQTDSTNAAAAVAQAAIHKHMALKNIQKKETVQKELMEKMVHKKLSTEERIKHQAEEWAEHASTNETEEAEYAQYPVPDVSTYQYDESSGYYYDPSTGLYYDANSQYYYNSTTGQFMYWDGERKTYLPAPTDAQAQLEESRGTDYIGKNKDNIRNRDKVKVAKKIAKDMEKWAKTLNSQKEAQRDAFKKMFQPIGQQKMTVKKEASAADAGFALLEKSKKEDLRSMMPPPPAPSSGKPKSGLVASYGDDSENEEPEDDGQQRQINGVLDESTLTDYSKMACLLCKRQFQNKDALQRHQQLSDLHKKNLEELRKSAGATSTSDIQEMDSIAMTIQYRDRAKERREKYGAPAPPVPKKSQSYSIPFEQPTSQGIRKDNKGSKLLQKMGWNEGQGLGKKGQGIVDPIMASKRTQGAGLGVSGSSVDIDPNDTYKEACKKIMKARFNEMD